MKVIQTSKGDHTTGQRKNEAYKIESSGEWNENETVKGTTRNENETEKF